MVKTYQHLEVERRQKIKKRRYIRLKFQRVYRHDFDAA